MFFVLLLYDVIMNMSTFYLFVFLHFYKAILFNNPLFLSNQLVSAVVELFTQLSQDKSLNIDWTNLV